MVHSDFKFPIAVQIIFLLGFLLLFYTTVADAQNLSQELELYNNDRLEINKKGMLVLSGWALTNIASGSYGFYHSNGRNKYFHQMNAFWNVVNLSIGVFTYYQSALTDPSTFNLYQSMAHARSIENLLLLNIGLNVGYIATGGFLWERGIRKENQRLLGYGPSLVLQGGFLLVFDTILYTLNRSNNQNLFQLLDQVQISGTRLSLQIPF